MKKALKKFLYSEMYTVELNGIALVGWIVAAFYGTVCLIKNIIGIFH